MAKIKCEICKEEFHNIRLPHLRKHGYTKEQYLEEFPYANLYSKEYSETRSKSGKITAAIPGQMSKMAKKAGEIAVKTGQIAELGRIQGPKNTENGKLQGRKNVESGHISKLGKIQGQINVEFERLVKFRTTEHQRKAGKVSGQKKVDSGEWSKIIEKSRAPEVQEKKHQTNILNGRWVNSSEKTEWKLYRQEITRLTVRKENYSKIPLIETHILGSGLDVDHMYSVYDGFVNHVPAEIVANYVNCCVMPEADNIRKCSTSSITLAELCRRYYSELFKKEIE